MRLKNKRILITGGTSGIGLETVKLLCQENEVIIISRNGTLPNVMPEPYKPIALYHADLAIPAELEEVADKISREYASIDILVNNAAVQFLPEFLADNFNYDGIHREIQINFTSVCQLTYLMLPLLDKSINAVILNVNSGLALAPKKSSAIYCATKAALNVFSQSLSYQLENTRISVQQAFLPLVDTHMTEGRGTGKLSASFAAKRLILGIETSKTINDIGKAKILRLLMRFFPRLGLRLMRGY